jgi:hypothetical protein
MTPMPQPEPRSCCLSLSSGTLNDLAYRIRCHRRQHRSRRRRRLEPGRQALLALAPLRTGGTCTRPAAGFEVGVSTAWRYVRDAIAALATAADDLSAALQQLRDWAFAIPDDTLMPSSGSPTRSPITPGSTTVMV